MITAPTRIDIIEPAVPHPPIEDGLSTYDVAQRLEHKYSLIEKFIAIHKTDIEREIAFAMADAIKHDYSNERMDADINGYVKEIWRNFVMNEEHGIRTHAAEVENRQSFVKTGTYMNNFRIEVGR